MALKGERYYGPYYEQHCVADVAEYDGDDTNAPYFDDQKERTLSQCEDACSNSVDGHDRECVAIVWHDDGTKHSADTKRMCKLAWACDKYARDYDGYSVYSTEPMYLGSKSPGTFTCYIAWNEMSLCFTISVGHVT